MPRLLLVFLLALHVVPASAQEAASIRGAVTDAQTGEVLVGANVVLENAPGGVATDGEGAYRLGGLAPGAYTVAASYLGYERARRAVTLQAGEVRRLDLALAPTDLDAGEVFVEDERTQAQDVGVVELSPEEIMELPTVLEPDVFRALQLLPGIKAASDFSSGLYIRGGSPAQTLIRLDRATVYNPSHVFGFFSTFNADAIGDVRVYKGGYPAEYGGRLGSVVDIYSKDGNPDAVESSVSAGLLASRASAGGPYAKGTWMLAARRSTLEPLFYALRESGVDDIPESFAFYDLNGRITFDASPRDRLALSGYAGRDRLDYIFLGEARFDVAYGNRTLTAEWLRTFSDDLFTSLSATASRYESTPTATISGTDFEQTNNVWDYALEADAEWDAGAGHTLGLGARAGSFTFRLQNRFDGEETFAPRVSTPYASAYVQDTYAPASDWEITGGLRASYYEQGRFFRLHPRLSVEHRPSENVRLQATYGRYAQYLTLVSSELFSAFDIWLTANDGVPPSYGDQFVLGLKTELPQVELPLGLGAVPAGIRVDVEAYYRTMRQLFEVNPQLPDFAGLDYAEAFRFGEGYAYGAEFFLRKENASEDDPWSGFVSYALSQTRRRFEDFEDFRYFPPKYDRRHDLSLVLSYDFAPTWRATGVFTYGTGQATTKVLGLFKLQDEPLTGRTQTGFVTCFNCARLPAYHRLDLGVRKKGRFFGWADYELQLQLVNAYGRRNIWFYFYEPRDDNTIERNEVPQIPIPLPNVALTLRF